MGARQSKRSVDITGTPTKGEVETIGEGEGRVVKIGDADIKTTTNGVVPHTDIELGEKDENAKDITVEKENKEMPEVKENGVSESEEAKTPDSESVDDNINETEKCPESAENKNEETLEAKKQKEKKKKKWSFRSISFSKKDKSKPSKDSEKNGEVKEVAEENIEEPESTPTTESTKIEKPEVAEPALVLNGEASKDEIASEAVPSEAPTPVEEPEKQEPVAAELVKEETPKVEEPKVEEPKAAEEEPAKVPEPVVESASSPKDQEEPALISPPREEFKEVGNEELPPPLPSSNPPSSVTVFAESTKADILTTTQIDLLQAASVEPSKEVAISETIPVSLEVSEVIPTVEVPELEPKVDTLSVEKSDLITKSEPSASEIIKKSDPDTPVKKSDVESNVSSLTEVVTKTVPETEVAKTEPVKDKSADAVESDKSVVESEEQVVSQTSLSEIKVASESLTSIPDPQLSEPDVPKNDDIEKLIVDSQTLEEKVTNVQSSTSLEPQLAETNLLKDKSVSSEKPSVLVSSENEESPIKVDNVVVESQILTPPLTEPVNIDIKDSTSQHDTSSEISVSELNKTEQIESLSSLPPETVKINPLPKTSDSDPTVNVPVLEKSPSEGDHVLTKNSSSEVHKDDLIQSKSSDISSEVEITSVDDSSLLSKASTDTTLVDNSEESSSLPGAESLPEVPVPSVEKVEDSESKSVSEEYPVDLPSPSDLHLPSSGVLVDPADSLQDISTESLPSLPEPVSEMIAEPMSLPPVDSVPEPIATDCIPPSESAPLPPTVFANGNTNGLDSPNQEDAMKLKEVAVKQVPPVEAPSELVKEGEEHAISAKVAAVEE